MWKPSLADFVCRVEGPAGGKKPAKLEDVRFAQAMNYCEAYHMKIGLLINFSAKSLEFKRVDNNKLLKSSNPEIKQS